MYTKAFIALALLFSHALESLASLDKRSIPQSLMDSFERFILFAEGADQLACPSPLGTALVNQFSDAETDTQGFIARDDTNEEIIVSFRGSTDLQDFVTDLDFLLVDFSSPGVTNTNGVKVHQGFMDAYNSVANLIISNVSSQLAEHPSYSLVSVGHSLGGALSSLGGVSLASNFPNVPLKVYTFGQPRTGNPAYATLAENLIGPENIFRAVETFDGVPTIPPISFDYEHHETQYWVFKDPNTDPKNVKICVGREDPTCSDSIPSTGINIAHLTYFGQVIPFNATVCT